MDLILMFNLIQSINPQPEQQFDQVCEKKAIKGFVKGEEFSLNPYLVGWL